MVLASGIDGPVSVVWQIRGMAHGAKIQPSQAKNAVECTVANQPNPNSFKHVEMAQNKGWVKNTPPV